MASVKKSVKSSETKQTRTRSSKVTAAKHSAGTKARKASASRTPSAARNPVAKKTAVKRAAKQTSIKQQAAKPHAAKKSVQKVKTKTIAHSSKTAAKTIAKAAAAKIVATKIVATKTVATKTAAVQPFRGKTPAAAGKAAQTAKTKNKALAATRAEASAKSSAARMAKTSAAVARRTPAPAAKSVAAPKISAAQRVRNKLAAEAVQSAAAIKTPRRKAASQPETVSQTMEPKSGPPPARAAKMDPAAALLALKQSAERLAKARKEAAAPLSAGPAEIPSNLVVESTLKSNEPMTVSKEAEKKNTKGIASEKANMAPAHLPGAPGTPAKDMRRVNVTSAGTQPEAANEKNKTVGAGTVSKSASGAPAAGAASAAAPANLPEAKPSEKPAAPASKMVKAASSPRPAAFKPGEFVVYPAHGVGQILVIEEQEVAGFKLELYVISFIKDKMTLKVPTLKAASVGMRRLADASAVKAALDTLAGRARIKRTMWSRRAQEYEAKINSGDLNAIAEVVRDLYRSETQPEQSYSERQLYEAALDRMARELIVVQKLTETESLNVIEAQLQKGPRRGKAEDADAEEAEIEEAA